MLAAIWLAFGVPKWSEVHGAVQDSNANRGACIGNSDRLIFCIRTGYKIHTSNQRINKAHIYTAFP